jgi:hypothetical protein
VEISIDKTDRVVWLKLQAGDDTMEIGIPVSHAYGIAQALQSACGEMDYDGASAAKTAN